MQLFILSLSHADFLIVNNFFFNQIFSDEETNSRIYGSEDTYIHSTKLAYYIDHTVWTIVN